MVSTILDTLIAAILWGTADTTQTDAAPTSDSFPVPPPK
jgi:hypothetical protein